MKNTTKSKKRSPVTIKIGQFIYLSFTCFNRNLLWESASSCAFGFICSFVPIVFIISAIVMWLVRVSPGMITFIEGFLSDVAPVIDFSRILKVVMNRHTIGMMDVVLGFWIVWIARKLSLSIIRSMYRIFGAESKRKNWWNQVLTFISEFVLVIMVAVMIIATFIIRNALSRPVFETVITRFPIILSASSNVIAQFLMYFIIFVCTVFSYKFLTGVKPAFSKCFFYALLNTLFFSGLVKLFDLIVNTSNYNLVYGTISYVFILIIKIYFFFVLFLLFAQMIYVSEYFEQLLKSQIYFLPQEQDTNLAQSFIRLLFINPSSIQNEENTIYFNPNDKLFSPGQPVTQVYYLRKGIISETTEEGSIAYLEAGSLLGTSLCIINGKYESTAIALTKCEVVSFTSEEFMQILEKDPKAAAKSVQSIHRLTKQQNYKRSLTEKSE